MVYHSHSAEETHKIAAQIAHQFQNTNGVLALSGDLGAGKTTFTQGFAKALGIEDRIISPTFVLMRQHKIPDSEMVLFHIDLYRLEKDISLQELGIAELLDNPNALVLIEWAEKVADQLPKHTHWIMVKKTSEFEREIELKDA